MIGLFIGLSIIVISGAFGAYLDMGLGVTDPALFYALGGVSSVISMGFITAGALYD